MDRTYCNDESRIAQVQAGASLTRLAWWITRDPLQRTPRRGRRGWIVNDPLNERPGKPIAHCAPRSAPAKSRHEHDV